MAVIILIEPAGYNPEQLLTACMALKPIGVDIKELLSFVGPGNETIF